MGRRDRGVGDLSGEKVETGWREMSKKHFKYCCGQAGAGPQASMWGKQQPTPLLWGRTSGANPAWAHPEQVLRFPLMRKKADALARRRGH